MICFLDENGENPSDAASFSVPSKDEDLVFDVVIEHLPVFKVFVRLPLESDVPDDILLRLADKTIENISSFNDGYYLTLNDDGEYTFEEIIEELYPVGHHLSRIDVDFEWAIYVVAL